MHKHHEKTSIEDLEHDPWVDGTSLIIYQLPKHTRAVLIGKPARSKQPKKISS